MLESALKSESPAKKKRYFLSFSKEDRLISPLSEVVKSSFTSVKRSVTVIFFPAIGFSLHVFRMAITFISTIGF